MILKHGLVKPTFHFTNINSYLITDNLITILGLYRYFLDTTFWMFNYLIFHVIINDQVNSCPVDDSACSLGWSTETVSPGQGLVFSSSWNSVSSVSSALVSTSFPTSTSASFTSGRRELVGIARPTGVIMIWNTMSRWQMVSH